MVLSNKKLKQKLRAAVAESVAASVGGNHPVTTDSSDPEPNSQIQSLKELLGSATQKPRLSKREKRREAQALASQSSDVRSSGEDEGEEKKDADSEEVIEKKIKKKRKRDADGVKETENGVKASAENDAATKKKKKKKKKNKVKKKKKKKKEEDEEQNKGSGTTKGGSEEQGVKEAIKIDSQENGDAATKVYVGGIPYYSTEDDIRSYFEGCGSITEVDCMLFPETGKFRGIAIISFKTEAAAKRALALDGADMGGLYLKIQPYKTTRSNKASDFAPEMVEGYNRIYVGNLHWDITEDDLKKFFSSCSISSIRFGMDKETGEFRGYAHVDFTDDISLTTALKLDQEIVCGRPVKVRCAVPKKGAEAHLRSAPTSENASKKAVAAGGEISSGSGKKKRRKCYGCGVKGHLFSDCPNKQAPNAS